MKFLYYDLNLETNAQGWADKQTFAHSPKSYRFINGEYLGENVYIMFQTRLSEPKYVTAVQLWYNEYKKYDSSNINSYLFDASTGHYTQLVWANTARVGCGVK